MAVPAQSAPVPSAERAWWLRTLAVFQSPTAVLAALRDDSDEQADARQEPVLVLVLLAGIATILSLETTATLLDPPLDGSPRIDGLVLAVVVFLQGIFYGLATFWILGGILHWGLRAAGAATSYRQARHVLAFAAAPLALSLLVVWPVRLALYGGDVFRTGGADEGAGDTVFGALELGFMAWSVALLVVGVRALNGWSLWRSLGGLVLAGFALLALALVVLIVGTG
jgi:hypothetical protein